MAWVVVVSVLILIVLSLLRVNVIFGILIAAGAAGLMSGLSLTETTNLLVSGMGGLASTALSYVLLGIFAAMIAYSGIISFLVKRLIKLMQGKRYKLLLVIAGVSCLSQNVIPVHIAFIPVLIPPLLHLFDKMKIDRRGIAAALTFGLKAPSNSIPLGFGLIFQTILVKEMTANGMAIELTSVTKAMIIPGIGMLIGLLFAVFISYRKDRELVQVDPVMSVKEEIAAGAENGKLTFTKQHLFTLMAIICALIVQIMTDELLLGALAGIFLMVAFVVVPFRKGDHFVDEGIKMMGMIAFIMLIASGYSHVLEETGSIDALVSSTTNILGDNRLLIAVVILLIGLLVVMGTGTSFGTVPIIAALYVPVCAAAGFSPMATAALIGTACALGDAGSPASDMTLGPTAGLNADGKHDHIWDTCVPTFLHFNIPLFITGLIAALIL
ncbi:sodium:proton antiporter [Bacillus aerolatus]|uniref:Sodium:proton antiporter n=1 Tax=Bacillus aerolatus TaxID=2653354 RepID=A0A6I1FFD7_9BACI|nr:Na+/H+ antiporter NhaC family protein [Bacillus aerolatus]KAB7704039.1 sodium:proton antiporter [Bacillus aerolatus]